MLHYERHDISSVIRQKSESQKRVFQENKARQIFRKMNISYPLICICLITNNFSHILALLTSQKASCATLMSVTFFLLSLALHLMPTSFSNKSRVTP